MKLDFDWAAKRWDDPLTGTEVVCISPNVELHFRNSYFRCTMFTRDGTKMALMSHDPDEQTPSAIWCIDLLTGETEKVFEYGGRSLSSWGFSPRSHLLHVIDITEGRAEIVQIDADAGEQRRIRPTETLASIPYAESTADDRYIFSHVSLKKIPEGTLNTDRIAMMGSAPDRNLMYRVDLNDGKTDVAFETDEWWMGHCNPNPVSTNLFMCCQEGFIWTEEYPRPENFQRQRIYNFDRGEWLDLQGTMQSRGSHEHWSANGRSVYSHGGAHGCHAIYRTDLETEKSYRYVGPRGIGNSIHVAPAPDESFVIGDGFNFCKDDVGLIEGLGEPGDGDNPWSWDGLHLSSPGETIWKYELPAETLWPEGTEFESNEEMHRLVEEHPEKTVRTTPLCKFRSRSKLKLDGTRLESNAHVTPDSRWGVFQSSSEDGLFEVWAARAKA